MSRITLDNFKADNIPTQKQVEDLGLFLIENFEDEIGKDRTGNGEGAIEMAVRLLIRLKEFEKQMKKQKDHKLGKYNYE